jgi:hypothetical protein
VKVLKAFARLYLVSMAVTFAVVFATKWGGGRFADWRQLVFFANVGWGRLAVALLTFRHTIAFLTLLRFYCLLLLLLPVILYVLKIRKERLLLLVSGAIWMVAQLTIAPRLNQFDPAWIPIIRVICWQSIYILGAVIGYRRCIAAPSLLPNSQILIGICGAFAVLLFVQRHQFSDPAEIVRAAGGAQWFWEDMTLGPMRLLNIVILIIPVSFVFSKMTRAVENFSPWRWLAYLGQHSIYIFAASLGTTYLGFLFRHQWAASGTIWQTAWVAAALSTLWAAGALHEWLRSQKPIQAVRVFYEITLRTVRLIAAVPRRQFLERA